MNQKQKYFIKAEKILKYIITDDDETDTLIMCKSSEIDLVTSDYDIYKALASVKPYDNFKLNKLAKFFEVAEIISYKEKMRKEKPILKENDVEELRKLALEKNNNQS
ncbi:MAG: hypothetical protein KAU20_03030 [Nanoarchaeota archaeon]|nr:hypothetical protein [Nanoarchaeota archaeon]